MNTPSVIRPHDEFITERIPAFLNEKRCRWRLHIQFPVSIKRSDMALHRILGHGRITEGVHTAFLAIWGYTRKPALIDINIGKSNFTT